jgi:hypothetical protein
LRSKPWMLKSLVATFAKSVPFISLRMVPIMPTPGTTGMGWERRAPARLGVYAVTAERRRPVGAQSS